MTSEVAYILQYSLLDLDGAQNVVQPALATWYPFLSGFSCIVAAGNVDIMSFSGTTSVHREEMSSARACHFLKRKLVYSMHKAC